MTEALAFHLLNRLPGCGAKTIRILVNAFGTAEKAWNASKGDWLNVKNDARFLQAAEARIAIDITAEDTHLKTLDITVIPFSDPLFPKLLNEIPDAPALLYTRGSFQDWNRFPLIALVGSRKYTSYGKQVAMELARSLSQAGCIVVSGLAFGIDGIAHESALEGGSPTLAILGSGIDDPTISPQSHLSLAERVRRNGALISELAPGVSGSTGTFPARNRIMAGMCLGTVVIEAAPESGSLITARLALEYNRDVFAVPGSIFSSASAGTNLLLKQGAKVVTGVQDILEELAPHLQTPSPLSIPNTLTPEEETVLTTLSQEALHVDKLILLARLEATRVSMILTKLELAGLAKNIGNMHYIRVH